jgi:hypothetical protein
VKYKTPQVTALTPAINAIQTVHKSDNTPYDNPITDRFEASTAAYQDWES